LLFQNELLKQVHLLLDVKDVEVVFQDLLFLAEVLPDGLLAGLYDVLDAVSLKPLLVLELVSGIIARCKGGNLWCISM